MGGKRISITITDEQQKALEEMAQTEGLGRSAALVRSITLKALRSANQSGNVAEIVMSLENSDEVTEYVRLKRFGTVASFATYAMENFMQRNPLTAAQKALVGKNIKVDEATAP
jgi:ribbon-helix-helix protein, copG family